MKHLRWTKSGRTFEGDKPGQFVYQSRVGQKNVPLGGDEYVPYIWDEPTQSIRYANNVVEFHDWYQVIKDYETSEVLIDDQRFEVQYFQANKWRVLDLWQHEITIDQQDDHCIVTKRLFNGQGSELLVKFLFRPHRAVKLTFILTVADAGKYRIRFQNTGIAGELTEKQAKTRGGVDLGVYKIFFDKIFFKWTLDEIGIHEGYTVETQAGGKKLDFFLGEFDLLDGGSVIISPTTWGPTETSDDCDDVNGVYEDEYSGAVWVGQYGGEVFNTGWIWNPTVPQGSTIEVGTKITVTANSSDGSGCQGRLKAVDEHPPGAWAEGNSPVDKAFYADTTVEFDLDQNIGTYDSPELNVFFAQITDDVAWESGNAAAVCWMDDGSANGNDQAVDSEESGDGAVLTVVYTAGAAAVAPTATLDGPLVGPFGGPI